MLHSTKGIVLHTVKYSETSLIAKIYTETFGLQSYIIKGIRDRKSKTKPALFQHLSLVNMVVYHRERPGLQSIREIQIDYPYSSLPFDIRKSSIALFITEVLYKSIREEESNPALFRYLWESCIQLDNLAGQHAYYPIWFLLRLSAFLGFKPRSNYTSRCKFFNMKEGVFQEQLSDPEYFLDESLSAYLYKIADIIVPDQHSVTITPDVRNLLLEKIIQYYQLHLSGFNGLRSYRILHTVLG